MSFRQIYTSIRQLCNFHWCQAVYRNLKKIGLVKLYRTNEIVHKLLKRILSLHLLPPEKIPKIFHNLQEQILHLFETDLKDKKTDKTLLKRFLSYVDNNWIVSSVWPPIKWPVFNQPIRTNNDAEGWHNRVNGRMNAKMNFYVLVPSLHQEAKMIPLNKKLLCQDKIKKRCRKITASVNARLIELWESYPEKISRFFV